MSVTLAQPNSRDTGRPRAGSFSGAKQKSPGWLVRLFLFSLLLPFFLQIGPLLMTPTRLLLTVGVLPLVVMWARGKAGPVRKADIALFLMWAWIAVSFLFVEGVRVTIEASGVLFIETIGAYLLGRCFIRSADGFRGMVSVLFWIIAAMFPFTLYETFTGHNILLEYANRIWPAAGDVAKEPRWGLDRVGGVFSHPILFGIFCGSSVALVHYVLGYQVSRFSRSIRSLLVTASAMLSLSSGPVAATIGQLLLIAWDRIFSSVRKRWTILTGGLLLMIIALEIAANRSTPQLFIDYFAFDKDTAYNRLRIWDFGTQSVANHPLFGIGFNEWERPEWMSGSMDMFWLVPAVQSGLPAGLLLQLAFFSLFLSVAFKPGLGERASRYRTGYLVCLVGLYLGGWTVHYWKTIYMLFMFLLGSGAWLLDAHSTSDESSGQQGTIRGSRRPLSYSRFNQIPNQQVGVRNVERPMPDQP